jgi:hypothetical protein
MIVKFQSNLLQWDCYVITYSSSPNSFFCRGNQSTREAWWDLSSATCREWCSDSKLHGGFLDIPRWCLRKAVHEHPHWFVTHNCIWTSIHILPTNTYECLFATHLHMSHFVVQSLTTIHKYIHLIIMHNCIWTSVFITTNYERTFVNYP